MHINLDRVVRRKQLLELIGVSCATQWRMEKAGQFPARIKLGKGSVGWHLTEVEEWLKDRERVARQPAARDRLRRATDRLGVDSNLSLGQRGSSSTQTDGRNR
jgi:prophage regulatory protein